MDYSGNKSRYEATLQEILMKTSFSLLLKCYFSSFRMLFAINTLTLYIYINVNMIWERKI